MSWPFTGRAATVSPDINERLQRLGFASNSKVTASQALRHSAWWACLRLRADLVSTMPLDVYRTVGNVQVEVPKPPVIDAPGGPRLRAIEWLESSQRDLDSCGNAFGIITARDGLGLPARIELVPVNEVTVRVRKGELTYDVNGTVYSPDAVWHERQYTSSGMPVGLSPLAYAAMSINGYLSAQSFAVDWFSNSAVPAAHLKNTDKTLNAKQAVEVKHRFKAAISSGDVFVTGKDWDYSMLAASASESQFINERQFGLGDVCRFLGVPGDMIDASPGGSSVTYANVTQRNLQLLIMNLNPSLRRREDALSYGLLPRPRFVKFNRGVVLEMDLASRYATYKVGIDSRTLAPSEARELENRPPFTPEQEAEFARLFGAKTPTPTTMGMTP